MPTVDDQSKLAVVTGAAKPGYGCAITRRLLTDGFAIHGTFEAEDADSAQSLQREFGTARLHLEQCDHGNPTALTAFATNLHAGIQALVNAQFFFNMESPTAFDHALWNRSLAVNLSAPNLLVHELSAKLASDSSIVTITSTEGFIGSFGASAYAASKAAIHNLTKTFANNLGSRGIRANVVAAGWIGGVMDTDEVFNMSRRITPLGRLGLPEEIAAVVSFLLSKDASFVNGSVITADGGYSGVDTIAKYEFEQFVKSL